MTLKDLLIQGVWWEQPNRYTHEILRLKSVDKWQNSRYYPCRTRGKVRERFSNFMKVLVPLHIDMFSYGNNDAAYAYYTFGVAVRVKDLTDDVVNKFIDYVDGVWYLQKRESCLSRTIDTNLYVAFEFRWYKRNNRMLRNLAGYNVMNNIRMIEKNIPNYTNE